MQSENDKYYEKVEAGYYGDELPEESFDQDGLCYLEETSNSDNSVEKWNVGKLNVTADKWAEVIEEYEDLKVATFGAGCFWGTEKFFAKDFEKKFPGSIISTSVGFMNPIPNKFQNPTY